MPLYKHILVAVDLTAETHLVTEKAAALAKLYGADLGMIHVIEPMPNYAYGYVDMSGVEGDMKKDAATMMSEVGAKYGVPAERQFVITGHVKHTILELAKEKGVDLIILGSHGRHGLQLLLGSTANAVLHGAECDVLTVRIKD
jgi:universal stress protein A